MINNYAIWKCNCRYYADAEAGCQLYHICSGGKNFSQLCPNGTLYDQGGFTCANWKRVDCSEEGLILSGNLVNDFSAEQQFITQDLDVSNPVENFPWRNREWVKILGKWLDRNIYTLMHCAYVIMFISTYTS